MGFSWLEPEVVSHNSLYSNNFLHEHSLPVYFRRQIRLEDRFEGDIGNDFWIQQFDPFSTVWFGHKSNGPGNRYEVGVCIRSGAIVWLHGPFPCGLKNDLQIFPTTTSTIVKQLHVKHVRTYKQ